LLVGQGRQRRGGARTIRCGGAVRAGGGRQRRVAEVHPQHPIAHTRQGEQYGREDKPKSERGACFNSSVLRKVHNAGRNRRTPNWWWRCWSALGWSRVPPSLHPSR